MKMKNLIIILMMLFGISFLVSCEKVEKDPVLDMNLTVKPVISSPSDGLSIVLLKENKDSLMMTVEWSAATYNLTDLETTKYVLQMDLAGNNFASEIDLASTKGYSATTKVGSFNNTLLSQFFLTPGESHALEMRVISFKNQTSTYSYGYSDVVTINVTPYDMAVIVKPIYLIGDATPAGWDNTKGTPMVHLGDGKFAVVETLNATGGSYKFLSIPGQWAPQWGTDAAGTSSGGNLVYRPDEVTTDPPAIPSFKVEGDYYFMADTVNLKYETYLTSGNLFLVGDATPAGWDAASATAFTQTSPHIFTMTTSLNAGGGMKFLEVQGAWAPQYGTNDKGTNTKGMLSYRPTEVVTDPPSIPGPATAGQYVITVDLTLMAYTIEAAK
jgi:starch-binding outer membrane protein SusE/F